MRRVLTVIAVAVAATSAAVLAQSSMPPRAPSPTGSAAIQVGTWKADDKPGVRIATGKWIELTYGRPIKRGRAELFGAGADYGVALKGGKPVWRAGANSLTRFKTEAPLAFGAKTLPAGQYSLFIDLKAPSDWTLILSSQPAPVTDDLNERIKLWDTFAYLPDKDVLRVTMRVESLPYSMEELTYVFTDVTGTSGTLRLMWDTVMASVGFTVVP